MYDLETKTNKLHNTIIGRLMALFVTGVVCLSQAIPIYADDETKELIDFTTVSFNLITDNVTYFTDGQYDDVRVPVYIAPNNKNNGYFSGYMSFRVNAFNYVDGNSNRWVVSYFENGNERASVRYTRSNNGYFIYFDNCMMRAGSNTFLGYLHLAGNYTGQSLTLTCNNNIVPCTVDSGQLYYTTYEWGYVNAMIYALNNSANVEEMLSILNSIDGNMLPEILTVMRSNHTALYNLIQNVWTTDQAVLFVNRDIYNTVLSILAILEDQYASQASNVEDIKDHVQTELNNARQDMELTKPSQVANLADDYIDQIDTQYNYSVFSWLTAPTFILMMCIVAALAIISYMLYGGQ